MQKPYAYPSLQCTCLALYALIVPLCLQLEEYKDAFRIFDRHGQGSFTGADVEWVMRSLGQTPTQKQIEAIIRDMDLDNDGVIDLAEFMIRMMALTTKVSNTASIRFTCGEQNSVCCGLT